VSERGPLSDREREILRLVATGASNKEIARRLSISVNTVKVHIRNIFAKAGVASRTEATLFAIREGLVADVTDTTAAQPDSGVGALGRGPIGWRRRLWLRLGLASLLFASLAYLAGRTWQVAPVAATPDTLVALEQSRWQSKAAMPTARSGLAVAAYDNQIYAIGGETAGGVTGAVESYDVGTDRWLPLPPKPTAVADVQAAVLGGMIYVPGGRLPSGKTTDVLEVYDPRHSRWSRRASLPIAVSGYALAAFEGKVYLFGGWDGRFYLSSVLVYDPEQDMWNVATPMAAPRAYAGAAEGGGVLVVVGGFDGSGPLSVNEGYSPDLEATGEHPWRELAPLPEGSQGMGMASIADVIYVVGGDRERAGASLLEYAPQRDEWREMPSPSSRGWSRLGLARVGPYLYAVGGAISGTVTDVNTAYRAIYTVLLPLVP